MDKRDWPSCLKLAGIMPRTFMNNSYDRRDLAVRVQRLMLDIRGAIMDDSWSLLGQRWPVLGLEPAISGQIDRPDDKTA